MKVLFFAILFRHFCLRNERRGHCLHVRKRIDHCSVTTGKCQPSCPPLQWESWHASLPTGTLDPWVRCLVSHWNVRPLGWGLPVPTECQWWILFFLCEQDILKLSEQEIISCANNILCCPSKILCCPILSCSHKILSCPNKIFSCQDKILICPNNILSCANKILSCPDKIINCPNNI